VASQRDRLRPAIDALTRERPTDPVELWRRESALAAAHFLVLLGDTRTIDPS
jgi:hypothetical protein